ncbi:5-hydroxytryptamine receptor 6 isoform X4 [Myiozetetes cayanensis]|uniref:5-hydroxytryptamine receptor 6 isoform X4 n=2 Tax=Myiozetetes cayanensis TaxID=478635 RepID=UPI00215FD143|nr:5-hydroxytryptamine receptor 6 isoform X4 [Myiozetetes cayanensis]
MEGNLGAPNSSVLGEHSLLVGSSWVAAFLCFIILLTTAGNFLLILLIITQRSLRNTSNYFLVSLFMSDLMVGLVVMPPAMLNQLYGRWVLRGDFCSLWASFDVMCCSASILNLCIISLDRYLLIISPLKYKLRMTSCRALWLILATWTVAALASFLPIKMGWHKLEFEELSLNVTSLGDEDQCRLVVSLPYALVASCLTFFLPSAAISFTYCRILLAARKQAVQVASLASNVASTSTTDDTIAQIPCVPSQPMAGSESRRFTNKHSKKALKASLTLGILLGMFFVAWLPFFITNVTQLSHMDHLHLVYCTERSDGNTSHDSWIRGLELLQPEEHHVFLELRFLTRSVSVSVPCEAVSYSPLKPSWKLTPISRTAQERIP